MLRNHSLTQQILSFSPTSTTANRVIFQGQIWSFHHPAENPSKAETETPTHDNKDSWDLISTYLILLVNFPPSKSLHLLLNTTLYWWTSLLLPELTTLFNILLLCSLFLHHIFLSEKWTPGTPLKLGSHMTRFSLQKHYPMPDSDLHFLSL